MAKSEVNAVKLRSESKACNLCCQSREAAQLEVFQKKKKELLDA